MSTSQPKRQDVKIEDTWKLEDLFETDLLFENTLSETKKLLDKFNPYEGKLTSNPHTLLTFLKLQDTFGEALGKLYVYAHMRLHQDGSNAYYQDLASQSEDLSVAASEALAFSGPELTQLTAAQLDTFFKELPELRHYERYLNEILRQKTHILTSEMEAVLARVGELGTMPQNTFSMLNNVDMKFPTVENAKGETVRLTHGNYIPLMESQNRSVRESAFTALYNTYTSYKNTISTLFAANIKQYGFFSSMRHFETPLHSALSENNIPVTVYHELIHTVNNNLSIMHDYVTLRKEELGLDTLHMYDLFVPMIKDFEKEISYEESCDILLKALAPLGEDYLAIVKEALDNRWIDKYENEGKRSGAYSWGSYGAPHPYILLNYSPNINSLFTLAHEMGHALHSYYSHHHQPHIYGDYCIFVAEVASTVNEALLMNYLLETTQEETYKRYLINYFMEQFRSTLYRQTMFAEFELMMHTASQEGKTLTADYLCDTYYELVKKYHGPSIEVDAAIAMEWARIPHFYTPFYVYQYATGYSAAITLSERILKEGTEAVKDYKAFLSGGSSKDPIDLLKIAGVDMSTSAPIAKALEVFNSLIIQFKQTKK
ncbi:oligoendopeptidase F [Cellulosilyticum lentocellum]|uniref:Oligopeptidase F n=1 Tax=Cellulosilyticum lentocellum (strain ATCC 49066 / DSM 5427 / NCIMB 11756 / RHM5) TaxID=642492 RepID=F2JN74_CELLD|nr:oligoendopeptidase F [Cellulosilyticum lentocellum]ADZ83528.1 oligoendopeptidase F [Cellulosilyticum lentocellum DSM 5427]